MTARRSAKRCRCCDAPIRFLQMDSGKWLVTSQTLGEGRLTEWAATTLSVAALERHHQEGATP